MVTQELTTSLCAAFILVACPSGGWAQKQQTSSAGSFRICAEIVYQHYLGIGKIVKVDSETLSSKDAGDLQGLLKAARFFDLPGKITSPKFDGCCDRGFPDFVIRVETLERQHTVQINTQDAVPPKRLNPLLQWLENRALPPGRDTSTNEKCSTTEKP